MPEEEENISNIDTVLGVWSKCYLMLGDTNTGGVVAKLGS
jgi:hypothetical protein